MYSGDRVQDYRDSFGVIVQADGDGGDSANRTGAYWTYYKFINGDLSPYAKDMYNQDMARLRVMKGRYVRHPDPTRWYSNPRNFSRDQSINMQSAMVVMKDKASITDLFIARAKRVFFHFNEEEGDDRLETVKTKVPDISAPVEFGQFIRGMGVGILFPLLYILDLQLLFDVAVVRPITRRQGNKDFDVQYLPLLISAQSTASNFLVRASIKQYAKQQLDVEAALERYFREGPGLNGLKPLGTMAIEAYYKLIKGQL